MIRRSFVHHSLATLICVSLLVFAGCRGRQRAHVLDPSQEDMVGSHSAGAETYKPLVDEAVARLLGRHAHGIQPVGLDTAAVQPKQICFVGVENRSAEEIGDFKEQIYQIIDSQIVASQLFRPISKRFVDIALRETRLRPEELFLPQNRRQFAAVLEQQGQPFDFLMYATITSGTTQNNKDYQRDYVLTLEITNIHTGDYDKESATLRKGYHRSLLGKLRNYKKP